MARSGIELGGELDKKLIKLKEDLVKEGLFKKVDVDFATEKGFTSNKQVFSIQDGITKVRVYMWIEGQDVDCEDNASIGNFTFTLQLTSNRG